MQKIGEDEYVENGGEAPRQGEVSGQARLQSQESKDKRRQNQDHSNDKR
jgi:hypothetical protein